jgi:putative transposase
MPIPDKYHADFSESSIYHVFNRTNNKEKLFLSDKNHQFFLQKYDEYLSTYLETFAWCLLPNHFHFIVRVKTEKKISVKLKISETKLSSIETKFLNSEILLSEVIEHSFKRFFQSYALSFNKVHKRKGNLFYKPFKRIQIEKESHFSQAIIYIHANPIKHGLVKNFNQWKWSSWKTYLSDKPTKLNRQEVLNWFGRVDQFVKVHNELSSYYYDSDISIEE